MRLRKWDDLPSFMKCKEVRGYYKSLRKKQNQLYIKRAFDVVVALILLIMLFVPMIIIAVLIKLDSRGPVFYRQERVTAYGKKFKIHKFRTMVNNADKIGSTVTVGDDCRITKVGSKLRSLRLDELPQLIDVLIGNMSFVGARPEATRFVKEYSKEMFATLLLPAGITSEASIKYKDEAQMLKDSEDADYTYVKEILPAKMQYNLDGLRKFSFLNDIKVMIKTVFAVLNIYN